MPFGSFEGGVAMIRHNRILSFAICFLLSSFSSPLFAQQPAVSPPPDARFKADMLVFVAHPDDESMIAGFLARKVLDEHKRVAVVFATRGNAGQNLVGYEQDRSLAEIREMEARDALASIGIHEVWFLWAPDTPWQDLPDVLRSLEAWNHGNVLEEVVRFIRLTRPEVVVTMLPDVVVGENHEDHQAAVVIATEAFDIAGDPTWFPEQVAAPEDRLWFANLMEGLHTWQPEKLYYFTDASQLGFVKGKGPEYSMTAISPSQHVSYAILAAREISFHETQYDGTPAKDLASGKLGEYDQPVTLILGKSLVGGSVTGGVFQGVILGPIPFAPVHGYRPSVSNRSYGMELGGGWAFYKRFYSAHDLASMPELLPPEIGVDGGQDFSIPLLLHNHTDSSVTFELHTHLAPGWSVGSSSAQYAHHAISVSRFMVSMHDYFPVRLRLVAPRTVRSHWQVITWTATANGTSVGPIKLRVYVR